MKKAFEIFEVLRQTLHSDQFMQSYRLSEKAFTRKRTLTFSTTVSFILNLLKQSIPKELNIFSKQLQLQRTTRSAITQARKKLSAEAFVKLNNNLIEEFYKDNRFKTLYNFVILAVDGSTVQLPDSPELLEEFGCASNQTGKAMPMARISVLYDTLNCLTLDAKIKPYNTSERDIVIEHLEALKSKVDLTKVLIIFDRGYPSYSLIYYLAANKINYIMRCGSGFLKEINEVAKRKSKDHILTVPFKRASADAKKEIARLFPTHQPTDIIFRVVVIKLDTGENEILLTSLMCKKTYPRNIFKALYFHRWSVEEGYKFFKSGVEIESFSGKSCLSVQQDFHATVLVANAHALLNLEVLEELKKEERNSDRKYEYAVNKKVSIKELKNDFVKVLLNPNHDLKLFCTNIKQVMKKDRVPIRPERSFQRILKHGRRKYHMNQR